MSLREKLTALSFLLDNYSGSRKETVYAELTEMRRRRAEADPGEEETPDETDA